MKSTRIRIASVVATAALFTLTACSDEVDPTPAPPTPTESTSTTETPTETPTDGETTATPTETPTLEVDPATGQTNFCKQQDKAPFTGSAPEVFGQENVKDAYCEMGDLMISQTFVSSLVRAEHGTKFDPQAFSVPRDYMTDSALKAWDEAVARVAKGDPTDDDYGDVWAFMYFSLQNPDYSYYPEDSPEPEVLNLSVSPARTGVDKSTGVNRLLMKFTVKGDVNLLRKKDDARYLIPISKDVSLYLTTTGGEVTEAHNWYVDAWKSTVSVGEPYERPVLEANSESSE